MTQAQKKKNLISFYSLITSSSWLLICGVRRKMAMNVAHHKIVNLLKTRWDFLVIMCRDVFNVGPKRLFFQCGPEMPKGGTRLPGKAKFKCDRSYWENLSKPVPLRQPKGEIPKPSKSCRKSDGRKVSVCPWATSGECTSGGCIRGSDLSFP